MYGIVPLLFQTKKKLYGTDSTSMYRLRTVPAKENSHAPELVFKN